MCFSTKNFLFVFIVFLCVLVFKAPAFSQSAITVVGRGTTKEEALQDALRSAVEKATGVFLYSVTDVQDFKVVQDKIVAQSKGYVKDYQILEDKSFDGLIVLTVTVTVDVESVKTILRQDLKAVTYDDVLKDYMLVTQKMARLQKSAELLKAIAARPITDMYSFEFVGYKIEDIGLKQITGQLLFKVILNPFYWRTYDKILQQISDPNGKEELCGGVIELMSDQQISGIHAFVSRQAKIHPDLMEFKVPPQAATVSFYIPGEKSDKIDAKGALILLSNLVTFPSEMYSSNLVPRLTDSPEDAYGFSAEFAGINAWERYGIQSVYEVGNDSCCRDYSDIGEFTINGFCIDGFIKEENMPSGCLQERSGYFIFKDAVAFSIDFNISDPELIKKFNKIQVKVDASQIKEEK